MIGEIILLYRWIGQLKSGKTASLSLVGEASLPRQAGGESQSYRRRARVRSNRTLNRRKKRHKLYNPCLFYKNAIAVVRRPIVIALIQ